MGVYISAVCTSLPEWIFGLSIIGGLVVYIFIGLLVAYIVKLFKDNLDFEVFILALIFWPIVIVGGIAVGIISGVAAIIYYVVTYLIKLFAMPIVGVDKHDLKVAEDKILDKIDTKITREDNKIMDYLEYDYVPKKSKKVKTLENKKEKSKVLAKDKASKKKKDKKGKKAKK